VSRPSALVHNPVLGLPSAQRLLGLDAESRAALSDVLRDLCAEAAEKAQESWNTGKAPMAAYWKAVSVYSRHIGRAVRRGNK
jgi:hypothetical protein